MGRDVSAGGGASVLAEAAAWKARGQRHEAEGTPAAMAEALRCYDAALALFGPGPAAREGRRLAQGVLWMNRGNALQKTEALDAAVRSYDRALALLPEGADPAAQNARGAAWLNRGRVLQALGGAENLAEAIRSQEAALVLLRPLPGGDDPHFQLNLAGACLNLAHLLASQHRLAEASDAVDEGMEIIRRPGGDRALLRPVALRLFQLGAQLYALHQPQFLAEFVRENIDSDDPAFAASAREAIARARAELGQTRLLSADDPAALRLLDLWRELNALEQELTPPAPRAS